MLQVVFEPNAQGAFKEVLEVVMTDATVGGELWSRAITLTGVGHSPRIRGFPKFIDFGNVPVGFMAFAWVTLQNEGFVDDTIRVFAQPPFFASAETVVIKPKATRRLCLFFKPERTCSLVGTVCVLAGGRVLRVPCRGNGGLVRLQCNASEPPPAAAGVVVAAASAVGAGPAAGGAPQTLASIP